MAEHSVYRINAAGRAAREVIMATVGDPFRVSGDQRAVVQAEYLGAALALMLFTTRSLSLADDDAVRLFRDFARGNPPRRGAPE